MEEAPPGPPVGPEWGNLVLIFQPSCLAMIFTAAGTVLAAAVRALHYDAEIAAAGVPHADGAFTLDQRQAMAVPLLSSAALLAMFFFFRSIQFFLLLMLLCASGVGVFFALRPAATAAAAARPLLRRRLVLCSRWHVQLGEAALGAASGAAVVAWVLTGSMALNNVLGVCLCVTFISLVRLPSLKVTTMLLSALFCYDIFWVFFSESLFGKNVMVEAATQRADNPALAVAQALHLPTAGLAARLDLPVKLMFPPSLLRWDPEEPGLMLGLGDMALPGMLIALLLSEDVARWGEEGGPGRPPLRAWAFWARSYAAPAWLGYGLGMFMALGFGTVFQAAQPALLYLVPCTLAPAVVRARRRRELRALWLGWDLEREGRKELHV